MRIGFIAKMMKKRIREACFVGSLFGFAHAFRPPSLFIQRRRPPSFLRVQKEEELRQALDEKNFRDPRGLPPGDAKTKSNFDYAKNEEFMTALLEERPYISIVAEQVGEFFDATFGGFGKSKEPVGLINVDGTSVKTKRKIVVLGAGWASYSFLGEIDASEFDVTVVSPRNFFLFTPMLAASSVGSVELRSITDPIRNANKDVNYLEATCSGIDSQNKEITCENVICEGTSCYVEEFTLPYDTLVVAVGATTNTYGIPGVKEHCIFLKQIDDAVKLRKAIGNCFERANLPQVTDEQRKAALTFVVVGAGPTGVEFTSELRDFMEQDGPRFYSHLLKHVSIKLVEASDRVLMAYDKELQAEAVLNLTQRPTTLIQKGLIPKEMTEVLLKVGVKEISETSISLSNGQSLPYGVAVWAAGNSPLPIVLDLIQSCPEQQELAAWGKGRVVTDDWLRVKGVPGVIALGDCGVVENRPLPQTAQVAAQQGLFLARLFNRGYDIDEQAPSKKDNEKSSLTEKLGLFSKGPFAKGFAFMNLGTLAYTGDGNALAQISVDKQTIRGTGKAAFVLWRSVYLSKQVSWRNRVLVSIDWLKTRVFGRDLVRF